MQYETILVQKKDRVGTIILNRMDKMNAANRTMLEEISRAMTDLEEDKNIRVIVLTGQGKAFCAGEDVTGFKFDTTAEGMEYMKVVVSTYKQFESSSKVVIAAVNGYAFGYGAGIILACDIVIASEKAQFGLREINWGLIPSDILRRGVELMSKRDIAYLSLTGEDVNAHEAKAMGWINKVVPHEQLMTEVYALCDKLKNGPPLAQETIKRILNRKAHEDYDSYIEIIAALFATEDVAEARRAFLEKRKPAFKGK